MKRRVLTIALAVLLAVIGTGGVLVYIHQADARAVAGQRAVTVLVAGQAIPGGTAASAAVRDGLLTSQVLPASSVPANAVSSITPDLAPLVVSANIQPGQLLLRPMLVTAAQATGTGALAIPKGMVAVTVPLCMSEAVAGYVQPGSEVAVFDTYAHRKLDIQENCGGSSESHQSQFTGAVRTRIVLPRVQVLSVGTAAANAQATSQDHGSLLGQGSGTGSSTGSAASPSDVGLVLVTFAVSQANAERLILLTETGVSYLALLTPTSRTGFDTVTVPLFQP